MKWEVGIYSSTLQESENYKEDMLADLEKLDYNKELIIKCIREKMGRCLHELTFRVTGEDNCPLPGLRVKDVRNGKYLDLTKYTKPLIYYPEFKDANGYLIGEDSGWELDMPFKDKAQLFKLIDLFLNKSGEFIYDKEGRIITECENHWRDAWQTPVLLLGENAIQYLEELPLFIPVTKIALKENNNEISFVIHKNLNLLKDLPFYEQLLSLGFLDELCLGNAVFIKEYVDKKR